MKKKAPMVQISENEYQGLLTQSVVLRTVLSQVGGLYEILSDRMTQVAHDNVVLEQAPSRNTILVRLEPSDVVRLEPSDV